MVHRVISMTTSDNELQQVFQRMTASDNEWHRVVQQIAASGIASDNGWQRVTTNEND